MDYNYVRMRNALACGDYESAEHYRRLYETGTQKKSRFSVIDYVIVLLLAISILLGLYISYSELKAAEPLDAAVSEVAVN